jgi:uncharacterized membrane protein YgdD (TMEM256/DUF423 family)
MYFNADNTVPTASSYNQIYNGLGLCMVSMHPSFSSHRFAGPAIALGGFIFSSSIMLLVFNKERYVASL